MKLEVVWESHPQVVLELGVVDAVPDVGDYIAVKQIAHVHAMRMLGETAANAGEDKVFGYVRRRRFTYELGGRQLIVRAWIHKDPPQMLVVR